MVVKRFVVKGRGDGVKRLGAEFGWLGMKCVGERNGWCEKAG